MEMTYEEKIELIKKIHTCLKEFSFVEKRQIAWGILMGCILNDEDGLDWFLCQFNRFIK